MSFLRTRPGLPPSVLRQVGWLWLAFWIMKIASATLLHRLGGQLDLWKPLLWEGSSFLVTSLLAAAQLRYAPFPRHSHTTLWRWLLTGLLPLPLWCLLLTPLVYSLRHAVYALLGEAYRHPAWSTVYVYESLQLCLFYLLWMGVIYGISLREYLAEDRLNEQQTSIALRDARLALLRQQLQPHFLFNALNLVSATMYEDVPKADALLRKLASLLRKAATQTEQPMHSLPDELSLLRDYADIMVARFENRVLLSWNVEPGLPPCRVPTMIVQALLENAFKFGVEPFRGTSTLVVSAGLDTVGRLVISIRQSRGAVDAAGVSGGLGLENVRQRLHAHFGERASLVLEPLNPEGVCATLTLPCES